MELHDIYPPLSADISSPYIQLISNISYIQLIQILHHAYIHDPLAYIYVYNLLNLSIEIHHFSNLANFNLAHSVLNLQLYLFNISTTPTLTRQ